jgi:hypothetical protein
MPVSTFLDDDPGTLDKNVTEDIHVKRRALWMMCLMALGLGTATALAVDPAPPAADAKTLVQFEGAVVAVKADQPQQVTFMVHKAAKVVDGTW